MDFKLLKNRKIIDILIGDLVVCDDHTLPRMSGPDLCNLCTTFGLIRTYSWNGSNQSRWMYMRDLIEFLNSNQRVPELLSYLFQMERFDNLTSLGDPQKVKDTYTAIMKGAINSINAILLIAGKELRIASGTFAMADLGQEIVIIGKTNRDEIQNQMRLKFARKLQKRNVTEKSRTSYSQKWLSNVN